LPSVFDACRFDVSRLGRFACAQAIDEGCEILRDAHRRLVEFGIGEPIEPREHGHRQAIVEAVPLAPMLSVANDRLDAAVQRAQCERAGDRLVRAQQRRAPGGVEVG